VVDIDTMHKQLRDIFNHKVLDKKSIGEIVAHRTDGSKLCEIQYYDENVVIEVGLRLRSDGTKTLRVWLKSRKLR
jgi:hypothetical protein